ncbi:hypothetical protein [Leptospira kirschneri]|uniref:hypothetical protein n=1 Tax=Leptospira kirschneri TaxID=29507 RepID=UPI000298688A|nr:hypothetical protein [Leptospira kirschneri]EMO75632.1 hypothetical protein LEP1GSC127_1701 [Leptospira kirschneri str. 200801925]EKQ84579.1 hypothetical protein LEP1GSC064_1449 [Leptospira kirschneri serovar Grippotyphosa str. Moskva]EKR06780.1 hypothetical protein LEP1GSC122_1132 [Leptospira kirschneri serovar Valbuzzi str. 200702274]EMO79134.1 hypothetical protein LEP1GSC126_4231 [Leptospira kirschneri str. 200801774]OOV49444.1 hypothetical protein B1J94_06095 [Leptospira kirschneri sero
MIIKGNDIDKINKSLPDESQFIVIVFKVNLLSAESEIRFINDLKNLQSNIVCLEISRVRFFIDLILNRVKL